MADSDARSESPTCRFMPSPSTEFPMSMFDSDARPATIAARRRGEHGGVDVRLDGPSSPSPRKQPKTKPKRSCILLWMNGGPSTIDLWDLKPGHENGGPYKEIETTAPGLKIGEHLPKIAKHGDRLAILRGMSTKEGDHARGTYLMRTGQLPGAAGIQYPSIGALVSKELGDPKAELPNFVSIAPQRFFSQEAFGPGFLGPVHAPLVVGENQNFNNPQGNGIDVAPEGRRPGPPEVDRRRHRAPPGSTCSATCRKTSPPAGPARSPRATPPPTTAPSGSCSPRAARSST